MIVKELLEEASNEEEDIILDPEGFDFRPVEDLDEGEVVSVAPEDPWMASAHVDLVNENVEVRFSTQESREKYVAVKMDDDFSIVESTGHTVVNGENAETQIYYMVTDEEVFIYENGWHPSSHERPLDIALEAPELYRKALNGETDELDWGNDTDYVPPEEDRF